MVERRREARFTVNAPIEWENNNRVIEALTKDISYSGVFIETLAPCNLRDIVNIALPIGSDLLEIEGEVRWIRQDEDGNATGMGIYFLRELSEKETQAVTLMISRSSTETLVG